MRQLLQNETEDSYYIGMTEVCYKVRQALQSASSITKCDIYYKVRCNTFPVRFSKFNKHQAYSMKLEACTKDKASVLRFFSSVSPWRHNTKQE